MYLILWSRFSCNYLDNVRCTFRRETLESQSDWYIVLDDDEISTVEIVVVIAWVIGRVEGTCRVAKDKTAIYKQQEL